MEGPPQEAPTAERALLEFQVDVLALVDEDLIQSESLDNGKIVTTTRREDSLGRRLRQSMMFAVVRRT